MFRFLFVLFLVIPLIEIYFLIQVGQVIGAAWTIFLVVATAVIGAFLLRLQGFQTLLRAQSVMAKAQIPAMEMMEGLCLLVSGALLLTPGFFTDTLGFLLLLPTLRRRVISHILKNSNLLFRGQASASFYQGSSSSTHQTGDIIDGEIVDDEESRRIK